MAEQPQIQGGEGGGTDPGELGGTILCRNDLRRLKRFAQRYKLSPKERREMVEFSQKAMRHTKSHRTVLAAVNTLAGLDRLNLQEEQQTTQQATTPSVQVNVQVNNDSDPITHEQRADAALALLERARARRLSAAHEPQADAVHPEGTNGKAGDLPVP